MEVASSGTHRRVEEVPLTGEVRPDRRRRHGDVQPRRVHEHVLTHQDLLTQACRHMDVDPNTLTDLLTVHFGLGIFTANACFDFTQDDRRRTVRRLGY